MAKRVYISPSDQVENKYAWGNTNEHVQCQRIAEAEAAALRRCGVEVQLAKFGTSMAQRCAESNGALAPLTPGTSENIQANSRLYEVRTPAAPTAYVECEFHDNPETARWIIQHTDEIGEAIARGLCQYLGVAYAPAQAEKPAPQPKGDGLFRVQVGAFANRNNAEKMLERLKKAGFSGFISSEK